MSRFPPGVPTDVWEPVGEPLGTGVVLPGRGYPPAAPGLAYAGYVLRAAGWRADRGYEQRSMKAQMKLADRSGAAYAVIIGSNELEAGTVVLRALREPAGQHAVARTDLLDHLTKALR